MDTKEEIIKIRNSIDEQLSSVSEYKIPEFNFKDDTKNLRISIVDGYDKNISYRRKEISDSTNIIDSKRKFGFQICVSFLTNIQHSCSIRIIFKGLLRI